MLSQEASGPSQNPVLLALGILVLLFVYLLPTMIGGRRKVPNIGSVFVLNLFLGWTVVGWIIALAMAARTVPDRAPTAV